jgi:hypothetical protein
MDSQDDEKIKDELNKIIKDIDKIVKSVKDFESHYTEESPQDEN